MCVRQSLIKNRKYTMTLKNGGIVPICEDQRQQYVFIPCKQCYICRRRKAREWKMRITEDIKINKDAKIVTLTFNTESLKSLSKECKGVEGYELDNQICKLAVKRFRERWRKKYGRSPRHWLITELGHGETEHVHMHGIIWQDSRYKLKDTLLNEVEKIWNYGFVGKGKKDHQTGKLINYVDASTANYFTKYVNKIDQMHPEYKQIILTSAGIGKCFLESEKAKDNEYREEKTNQMYNVDNGGILPMPEYFRKKLYTDEQREKLTGWYLNKNIIYLDGKEISLKIGGKAIFALIKELRAKNATLGYGDGSKNWERKRFENEKRKALHLKRFWEGKTTAEKKKDKEKYWNIKPIDEETEEQFWENISKRAYEKKAIESITSKLRPNLKFDEWNEKIEKIDRCEITTKKEIPVNRQIYRYNKIDEKGYITGRYTFIEESRVDARIKMQKKLKTGEKMKWIKDGQRAREWACAPRPLI